MRQIGIYENRKYFIFVLKFAHLVGLYPENDAISWHQIIFALHFTGVVGFLIILEIAYLFKHSENYVETLKTIGAISYHIICVIRVVHWWYVKRFVPGICDQIARSSFKFENFGIQNRYLKRKYEEAIQRGRYRSYFVFTLLFGGAHASLLSSYLGSLIFPTEKFDSVKNRTVLIKNLPYDSYHFIDVTDEENFILEIAFQWYSIEYMTLCYLAVDTFLFGVVYHLTAQVATIGVIIENIRVGSREQEEVAKKVLVKCIDESQTILKLVVHVEKIYNKMIFTQNGLLLFILCTIPYISQQEKDSMKLVGYFMFATIACTQVLVIGWTCQTLTDEFQKLAVSAFKINYDEASPEFRKNLIFVMARFQKPIVLTMGKFAPINLSLFVEIIRKAYALYTLLTNTQKVP